MSIIVLTCLCSILVSCVDYVDIDFFFCRLLTSGYEYSHFLCLSSRFDRSLPCPNLPLLCCCFLYSFLRLFADTCPCLFSFFALGVCIIGVPWVYFSLFAVTFAGSLLLYMYLVVAVSYIRPDDGPVGAETCSRVNTS